MKVLIDSNVILEVILQREEYKVASGLLAALYEGKYEMFLTTGSNLKDYSNGASVKAMSPKEFLDSMMKKDSL